MKKNTDSFLEIVGIPKETLKAIQQALHDVFVPKERAAIRLAVIGECGVGKTSTINALFNTNMPVSHFGSCTQQAEMIRVCF